MLGWKEDNSLTDIVGKNLKPIFLCFLFIVVGPTIILVNKYILYDLKFHYPVFLSSLGVSFSAIFAQLLVNSGLIELEHQSKVDGFKWFTRILPICLLFTLSLATGNVAYLYLEVGFIQMFKSFSPVIVMTFSNIFGLERLTTPITVSVLIISIGTAATCTFSPQLSVIGMAFLVTAEVAEAVRLIMTQFLLQNLKFGVVEGQYLLAPASALCLFAACWLTEYSRMREEDALRIVIRHPEVFLAAASLGVAVNFLSYYVIQVTSSLTIKVLGGIRNASTVVLSALQYGERVDPREAAGYVVALAGFIMYSAVKAGYTVSTPQLLIDVLIKLRGALGSKRSKPDILFTDGEERSISSEATC